MRAIALAAGIVVALAGAMLWIHLDGGPATLAHRGAALAGAPVPAGGAIAASAGAPAPERPPEPTAAASGKATPAVPDPERARPSRALRPFHRAQQIREQLAAQRGGAPPADVSADPVETRRLLQEERAAAEAAGIDWRLVERMLTAGARAAEEEVR